MSRRTKRFLGNLSVLTVLVAIVVLLVVSAMSPSFLKNHQQLTAEANAHTPIVQALPSRTPVPAPRPIRDATSTLAADLMASWASADEGTMESATLRHHVRDATSVYDNEVVLLVDDALADSMYNLRAVAEQLGEQACGQHPGLLITAMADNARLSATHECDWT